VTWTRWASQVPAIVDDRMLNGRRLHPDGGQRLAPKRPPGMPPPPGDGKECYQSHGDCNHSGMGTRTETTLRIL